MASEFRMGKRTVRGWKAEAMLFSIIGLIFLSGLVTGLTL